MTLFESRHIGVDKASAQAQLTALGYASMDDLIHDTVPSDVRVPAFEAWPALSEAELMDDLRALASQNTVLTTYAGHGYVPAITPAVIQRHILENPGWYTPYTPYQAECAQGRLSMLFYFQSMVSDLTGLPIANASLLDEATAAAEAMTLLFYQRNRRSVVAHECVVCDAIWPQTLAVLQTRAKPLGIVLKVLPAEQMQDALHEGVFAMLFAYPDAEGRIVDATALVDAAHAKNVKVAMVCDLLALTQLKSPGECGADIACGSAQRFGIPLGYGGPHAAFFATSDTLKRQVPGRIVGVSKDKQGASCYRLALQTREQHIRREKATSNICTAQALLAVMSTAYAMHHGPEGLSAMAKRIHGYTQQLADALAARGASIKHTHYFDTLRVQLPDAPDAIEARAEKAGLLLGRWGDDHLITLSECTDAQALSVLCEVLTGEPHVFESSDASSPAWPQAFVRETQFLTHPVFNTLHAETALMRFLKNAERKDLSLVHSMIPLGSCTMKLNAAAEMLPLSWPAFNALHPMAPLHTVKGMRLMIDRLGDYLQKLTGFAGVSFQPNAGAQGEYAGLLTIMRYHQARGEQRTIALVPSSAHGTNPASAVMAGLKVVVVKCDPSGQIDAEDLKAKCEAHGDAIACLMLTYPSTFGVFDANAKWVCEQVHAVGGQIYLDGANMNAQLGLTSPAQVGADVCHLNLHKTFCIPHGGGGPGMGPIGVAEHLLPHMPVHPWMDGAEGDVVSAAPFGSASILLISYAYIRLMGLDGLRHCSEQAILNANHMAHRLSGHYPIVYRNKKWRVAHEFIIDCRGFDGIKAVDIAKRLMDYGLHAPTLSWPVTDTLMIEPTESEGVIDCDRYVDALIAIREEIDQQPELLRNAPHTMAMVTADEWTYPYSREQAAWPLPHLRDEKQWPTVARVDDVGGDRQLVCSCAQLSEYE